jgi:DNA repair exonuclease SbcCD ATPase subunit
VIPIRISLAGFLSYRERQELFFAGAPLWVLSGPNASGKTSVFHAITYAFYGKVREDVRVADLINQHSDRLHVELDFAVGDQVYRIKRTRSRSGGQTVGAFRLDATTPDGEEGVEPIEDTTNVAGLDRWVRATIGLGFDAFTATILLRQGKSEKLLDEPPSARFAILAELLDLSPYKRLYELVDADRKTLQEKVRSLAAILDDQPAVDVEMLASAQEAARRAGEAFADAGKEAQRLGALHRLAQQWEDLNQTLDDIEDERRRDAEILGRADEIERGCQRREELGRVLPELAAIVGGRTRAEEQGARLKDAEREITELEPQVLSAEQRAKEARRKADASGLELEAWTDKLTSLARERGRLAPLLQCLAELERVDARIVEAETELATIPADLDARYDDAAAECGRLDRLAKEHPTLEEFVAARTQLEARLDDLIGATALLADTDEPRKAFGQQIEAASNAFDEATMAERAASAELSAAKERHRASGERRDQFAQAANDARCSVCGQAISLEHAAEERERLDVEWGATKRALAEAQEAHEQASVAMTACHSTLETIEAERDVLERRRRELDGDIALAERRVEDGVSELERAYARLSADQQGLISQMPMIGATDWLSTTYPTSHDMEAIRTEVARRPHAEEARDELAIAIDARSRAEDQRCDALERRQEIELAHSRDELLSARSREETLAGEEADAESRRDEIRSLRDEEQAVAEEWQARWEDQGEELRRLTDCRRDAEAALYFATNAIDAALQRLPGPWAAAAETVTGEDLERLEIELDRFADYPSFREDLLRAQSRQAESLRREVGCRQKLQDVPPEAQRSSSDVEQELHQANERVAQANEAQIRAAEELGGLEERKRQREKTESLQREAHRQHHLHLTLANLLGKQGLQLLLLRRAEMSVVTHANELLDRLSFGRMRLRLRTEDEDSSERALDLAFDDGETGAEAIPIGLSSGSQRFRIALSLALGIGQYLSQETQHARSVIVDEGFGSLDRVGRASMIQELTNLQSELDRIILVSHQEEIAEAFPNGYSFALIDGASNVSMIHSA